MTFPLVRHLAAEGIPVRLTCGVLGFSTQAFYKWLKRPCSDRDWADAQLTNAIVDVHADDPEFGYRFIADELERAGHHTCERRVWRLCRNLRVSASEGANLHVCPGQPLIRPCGGSLSEALQHREVGAALTTTLTRSSCARSRGISSSGERERLGGRTARDQGIGMTVKADPSGRPLLEDLRGAQCPWLSGI